MKKGLLVLLCLVLAMVVWNPTAAEEEAAEPGILVPVITSAYELSAGKLYLEWTGNAPVYQVFVDGSSVTSVIVTNTTITLERGTHTIRVYPFSEKNNADTTIDFGLNILKAGGNISLDLAALGLDPKKLTAFTPSEPLNIDYRPDSVFESAPDKFSAITDQNDRILLSFTERQYADEYVVSLTIDRDVNHINYRCADPDHAAWIARDGNRVTLILDPAWLSAKGYMVPEIGEKCTFKVQMRKQAVDYITAEKKSNVIHESKASDPFEYTPVEAWKTAPEITYASQTADGEFTLRWSHDNYGAGCTYQVMKVNKTFGIKTGEERLGTVPEKEFVLRDQMNGTITLTVVPELNGQKGTPSPETDVEIKNEWVAAPVLTCEPLDNRSVRLSWQAAEKVETYHLSVYAGNNDSLLRYIGMDYELREERDITATAGEMSYTFNLRDGEEIPDEGLRFRFELYGLRHAENGSEQKTAVSKEEYVIN